MLIRNARVWPPGPPPGTDAAMADLPLSDVRLSGGQVAEHAPRLRPAPGEADIDAAGGTLLPGLHDHHVHLRALAAARASVAARPPHVRTADGLAARLRAADAELPPGAWLRAVGYHESVAGPSTARSSTGSSHNARCAFSTAPARCGWSTPPPSPGWA